jgi:hypothetical protein
MAADEEVDAPTKLAFGIGLLLVLVCVAVDNRSFTWVVGSVAVMLFLYVLSRVRLLYGLLGIMYFSLTLENANDAPAAGLWKSPFFMLGFVFMVHLNMSTGISFLSISGADALLIFLIIRTLIRGFSGEKLDSARLTVPKPLMQLAWLSLAGGFFMLARGWLRGGDMQKAMWQLERVTYTPIIFMLFQCAMRGTKDFITVGKVFLAAAAFRSAFAIYVMNYADLKGMEPAWATTHHDSMLFACSIVILVSLVLHRIPGAWKLLLLLAPLIIFAIVENNRRTAWVAIPIVFVTLFFAMPNNAAKKKIKKFALYTSPLSLAYIVVGWRSSNPIFKPVSSIRSVVEPAPDTSTLTRDIENYCLAKTIGAYPFLGLGYGHTFFQIIPLPPMPHPLEPWLPHNSLLGLWFAAGFVGYTMVTLLWTGGVFFGVRAYRAATEPMDRAVALVSFGAVLIYMVQCYADLGLGVMTAVYMVAPSIAIAGQLALKTGAWPAKVAKAAPARRPVAGVTQGRVTG